MLLRPGIPLDRLEGALGHAVLEHAMFSEHAGPAEDRCQGRPQFVRDDGQELVLGAARRLGFVPRRLQFALACDVGTRERRQIVFGARERALQRLTAGLHCQQVANAHAQLVHRERFHQVILRARSQQLHPHFVFRPRRQDEDRYAAQ